MKVLITGGAGYIGSTVASACLDAGITPIIVDNLHRGRPEFVRGRIFYRGDIADGVLIDRVFAEHPDIAAAVHCAALIVVPESVAQPTRYYRENVAKTIDLVDSLLRNGCRRVLFSSSAAVYDCAGGVVDESSPVAGSSPYARTKAMVEQVLADVSAASNLRVVSLRYFNPVGTDPQMRTGPTDRRPTHALGRLIEAFTEGAPFRITGVDWPTRDGTGIRDYIHVWDLALGHVAALRRFDSVVGAAPLPTHEVINLGAGAGVTVRELVAAFQRVVGQPVPVYTSERRPGDVSGCHTSIDKATRLLGWQPRLTLADGIRDALAWQRR